RATIGADSVTLLIWVSHACRTPKYLLIKICMQDTAGQERCSSLSTAFFRGADAALLKFDVNAPVTMTALTKWWAELRLR
ncbi:hypothetical protein FPV67DRAFT_1366674, partial [Lyophyllum atratum]